MLRQVRRTFELIAIRYRRHAKLNYVNTVLQAFLPNNLQLARTFTFTWISTSFNRLLARVNTTGEYEKCHQFLHVATSGASCSQCGDTFSIFYRSVLWQLWSFSTTSFLQPCFERIHYPVSLHSSFLSRRWATVALFLEHRHRLYLVLSSRFKDLPAKHF